MNREDLAYMEITIKLSEKTVIPPGKNYPRVGVLVTDINGNIIGKGWKEGRRHAEYGLLQNLVNKNIDTQKGTLYVTLEPCSHRNTAINDCSKMIINAGISRVVIGMLDPNPRIRGKGEKWLDKNNIRVEVLKNSGSEGELLKKIKSLNQDFLAKKRIVFFDLWGTLIKKNLPEGGPSKALGDILGKPGEVSVIEDFIYTNSFDSDMGLLEALGDKLDIKITGDMRREYRALLDNDREVNFYDGAGDIMKKLKSAGYSIGLISNAWQYNLEKIKEELLKIDSDMILFFSCEEGIRKPDEALFKAAVAKAGVDPGDAYMIGDSYECDCRGATRAGMRAFWLNREKDVKTIEDNEMMVNTLKEFYSEMVYKDLR